QEIEEERMQRVKLAEELKLGQKIQENLLPKKFPTLLDFEISAGFISAQEVGGDFYDIFPLSTKTLIAVADVAGKGISACLFSLGLRSSLRALAANLDSLSEIVQQANQLFLSDAEESSHFATLWIGVLEKRRLSFVNLGHPPALLKRGFSLQELTTDYAALGSMRYESIQAQSINLEEGDELLLFSDGATDAMDSEGQRYGIDRLKESFLKQGGAEEILHRTQLFSQSPVPHDDMTILHLRMI
ncbi:MAG TPA: SpoIIE family protein phosphatase, partial [Chlamydiales bacterium]|nr:SpoIIE family protein phosphatase [Chlamydiales bacterium]